MVEVEASPLKETEKFVFDFIRKDLAPNINLFSYMTYIIIRNQALCIFVLVVQILICGVKEHIEILLAAVCCP